MTQRHGDPGARFVHFKRFSAGVYMDVRALKAGMTPLFLPVPPMFEKCLGYQGDGRYVAFFWEHYDELCFHDDHMNTGTLNSASWLLFAQHPFVSRHFLPYDFGSAGLPARHWLLLDRRARRFYAGERDCVESFLEPGACPAEKVEGVLSRKTTITLDEFISMAGGIEEVLGRELFPEELMKRLQEQQSVCSELRKWLERLG